MKRATVARQLAAFALVCVSLVARADYPAPKDNYVNDYAKQLNAGTVYLLRDTLSTLERDTGVEMTVAVVNSVAEFGTGHSAIEPFATALFNRWGVGNTDKNDGILLLVAIQDRALRIELGSGYGRAADAVARDVIDRVIVPHFKDGAYAKGIQAGTETLAEKARTGGLPLSTGLSAWTGKAASAVRRFDSWPQAGAGLAILIVVFSVLMYYWRRRARRCPTCGAAMRRMSDIAEKRFLDAGEKLEETLKSVDYDVWVCSACSATVKIPYRSWTSPYSTCPSCHSRALRRTTQVLEQATYTSSGSELVSEDCRSCGHHSERTVTIPQRTRSSSSSSSSFGGGSSSGGGASGRW